MKPDPRKRQEILIDTAYSLTPTADVDLKFAYYLIRHVGLDHLKHGTSNPSLTRDAFGAQWFPVPPIAAQRSIAEALSALDDKIESNQAAVSLVQKLSQAIYSRWRTANASSSFDASFGVFAEVLGGATPRTSEPDYWSGGITWATPKDITALDAPYLFGTERTISQAGLDSTSGVLHPARTIFMTSRATVGAFAVTEVPAATNQGFIAVRPRQPEHLWFLFEEMRARVPEFLDNANGSTFMELSRGRFKQLPLAVPSSDAIKWLHNRLGPLHARAAQLSRETGRVAALRDALLPELLSGRIRVPEAQEAVAEVSA
jgi:type I restriction enzyme S subunit